jgi:hypothetical protein
MSRILNITEDFNFKLNIAWDDFSPEKPVLEKILNAQSVLFNLGEIVQIGERSAHHFFSE